MSRTNILLFGADPAEHGWSGYSEMQVEARERVRQLTDALLLDLAEECAKIHDVHVVICETETNRVSARQMLPPLVQSKVQGTGGFVERVREAVEGIYKAGGAVPVLAFMKPNPLFPAANIHRAMELLKLEDDVIIAAMDESDSPAFIATRAFHSCVYGSMRSLIEAGAFIVPLPSLKNITGMAELPYLSHEIERKVLLDQPVPRRTREVLKHMRRYSSIPEES